MPGYRKGGLWSIALGGVTLPGGLDAHLPANHSWPSWRPPALGEPLLPFALDALRLTRLRLASGSLCSPKTGSPSAVHVDAVRGSGRGGGATPPPQRPALGRLASLGRCIFGWLPRPQLIALGRDATSEAGARRDRLAHPLPRPRCAIYFRSRERSLEKSERPLQKNLH